MPHPDPAVGPFPEGVDPDDYDRLRRRVLWSMPNGLYLVGSRSPERPNLMTCNWAMQVATDPKLVAVSVDAAAVTAGLIRSGGGFTVALVRREDRAVVRRFVKPVEEWTTDPSGRLETMSGVEVSEVAGGLPVPARHAGWLACRVATTVDGGSHVLFLGEVVDAGAPGDSDSVEVLRMEDTRMSYGG